MSFDRGRNKQRPTQAWSIESDTKEAPPLAKNFEKSEITLNKTPTTFAIASPNYENGFFIARYVFHKLDFSFKWLSENRGN